MLTLLYIGIFAASLFLSFVLTRYMRALCLARGWIVPPFSDRHMHARPLPRLGGVAVFLSFLLSVGAASVIARLRPAIGVDLSFESLWRILVPACLIFALGVYDDLRPIGPSVKFGVQAIAGAMLYAFGLRIFDLPLVLGHHSHFSWVISFPLTILWVLAITNAFNLLDGLDGLAAGSALFSTLVVFVVAVFSHSTLVSLMTLALAGAILGFLRFNFNPATIFLGDSGSLFIGFMLSALALQGAQKSPTIIAVAIPLVSFGLPILETSVSVLRRFIGGRPLFSGDREHIHHKLLQLGFSHKQVVIVLYGVSAIFALLSLFLLWPSGSTLGLVMLVLGTGVWLGVQQLGYLEFGELRRVAQRTLEQRQIFVNNLAIRRATAELKIAQSYEDIFRVLQTAFDGNDFDKFELRCEQIPADIILGSSLKFILDDGEPCVCWTRLGNQSIHRVGNSWSLTLNLVTSGNRVLGSLVIYRLYHNRDLQFDVNLLTSLFPLVLADALESLPTIAAEEASGRRTSDLISAAGAGAA